MQHFNAIEQIKSILGIEVGFLPFGGGVQDMNSGREKLLYERKRKKWGIKKIQSNLVQHDSIKFTFSPYCLLQIHIYIYIFNVFFFLFNFIVGIHKCRHIH